jgi:hypothetical protein
LDHYNFTFSFFCFAFFFILTITLLATVYLPMIQRHQKVRLFHLKELLAREQALILESKRLLELRDKSDFKVIKK